MCLLYYHQKDLFGIQACHSHPQFTSMNCYCLWSKIQLSLVWHLTLRVQYDFIPTKLFSFHQFLIYAPTTLNSHSFPEDIMFQNVPWLCSVVLFLSESLSKLQCILESQLIRGPLPVLLHYSLLRATSLQCSHFCCHIQLLVLLFMCLSDDFQNVRNSLKKDRVLFNSMTLLPWTVSDGWKLIKCLANEWLNKFICLCGVMTQ